MFQKDEVIRKKRGAGARDLRRWVSDILHARDFDHRVGELVQRPAIRVVNALFPFLYSTDERIKRHAVRAMGAVFPGIADTDGDAAAVIIRRLMWSLNDESGGIGWGSPEAMGEILASHRGMAEVWPWGPCRS